MESRALDYNTDGTNYLDMVILGQLRSLCRSQNIIKTGIRSVEQKERKRLRVIYKLSGVDVCEALFLFANGIKIKRFKRILKHYKEEGLVLLTHKNQKVTPKHSISQEDAEHVIFFIRNYAEDAALFMPGRLANQRNIVKLLPSSDTKQNLFLKYKQAAEESNKRALGLSSFKNVWNHFCSDVVIMRPRTDLCAICQKSTEAHSNLRGSSEEDKEEFFKKCQEHIDQVYKERGYYKKIVQDTIKNFKQDLIKYAENGKVIQNSYEGSIHYSFDFAQQIHIPHDSQQPGPIYFLTPYKIGIFGIMNDTNKIQHNFFIPESVQVSKGANAIVSYLHFYFENHGIGETKLHLHADNCVAQNKNNIVMGYLIWRILKNLNDSISLSFLPIGHTKFSCDLAFGIFKKKFRVSKAGSLKQVEDIAHSSTPTSGLNKAVTTGTEEGNVLVPVYDWQSYFKKKKWKTITNITKNSHFDFSSTDKGAVLTRTTLDAIPMRHVVATDANVMNDISDFPDPIIPAGLSIQRKKYLYEKIRPYCRDEHKDLLCPKPPTAIAEHQSESEDEHLDSEEDSAHAPKRPKITLRNRRKLFNAK